MAANPKTLRIVGARFASPSTRVLEVECVDAAPFASVGGRYVIVNTGAMAGEKAVKRAYSLLPVAGAPHRAHLMIKRLDDGPGSGAMHAAAVGAELSFSGPWGKLLPEEGLDESALVVATDTGITAALGVVEQLGAAGGGPRELLWLRGEDETFLDVDDVRRRATAAGARFVHAEIPAVRATTRAAAAWAHVDARLAETGARVILAAGDGAIVHPLRARLLAPPACVREVRVECFFHNPERKIA